MKQNFATYGDIPLQHLLKGALAYLNEEEVDEKTREKTFNYLTQTFSEARQGSQALAQQSLLVTVNEAPALESFALIHNYLGEPMGEELEGRLTETIQYFEGVNSGVKQSQALQKKAKNLIELLLSNIEKERSLRPLIQPNEAAFG